MPRGTHSIWDVIEGRAPATGVGDWLGRTFVDADPEGGKLRARFEPRPEHYNSMGQVQGGILSAMLDSTIGPALSTTLAADEAGPTLELKVSFLRPARGTILASGEVLHRTASIAFMEGSLEDVEGNLVARATATVKIVKKNREGSS
jgi:uncharacterized protein (TIGR00369 family)